MSQPRKAAAKRSLELFTKNTGLRKVAKDDVCSLTPALCRKVKGSCQGVRPQSNEPKPRLTAAVTITVLR